MQGLDKKFFGSGGGLYIESIPPNTEIHNCVSGVYSLSTSDLRLVKGNKI